MKTPDWERIRGQVDSGAIDAVGPKDVARAFEMKKTLTSKKGVGHVAANWRIINNYGKKKTIGHTESGDGVSIEIQRKDVKKALGSDHEMSMGGNAVALDGDRSYAERGHGAEDEDQLRGWPLRHAHVGAIKEERSAGGDEQGLERKSVRDFVYGE